MIDKTFVKENYYRMSDEELIHLAETEGQNLEQEALDILHEVFLNRKLDTTVLSTLEEKNKVKQKHNVEEAQKNAVNEFINSTWMYAFDEKEKGATDQEIHEGLMQMGLEESYSLLIIKTLESKAKRLLKKYTSDAMLGVFIFFAGIIITVWTYTAALNGGSYYIFGGGIIIGGMLFFRAIANKEKFEKIVINIEAARNVEVNN